MVAINYICINVPAPKGAFGGSICMCQACEQRRRKKKEMEERTVFVLPKVKCVKCEYEWTPKQEKMPVKCPNCQSRKWYRKEENKL